MIGVSRQQHQLLRNALRLRQYVCRLLFGDMLAQVSRYPLRVPLRIATDGGGPIRNDRFIQKGAALLVGLGLCISSFSLKKLSAMPARPRRLL